MQSKAWIELIRRIPSEIHERLSLTTISGTEIVLQQIVNLESESITFKGRMSGSQDTGRVFFVPYDQIDYVTTINPIPEDEVRKWFGMAPSTENSDQGASNGQSGGDHGRLDPRRAALLDRVRARSRPTDQ